MSRVYTACIGGRPLRLSSPKNPSRLTRTWSYIKPGKSKWCTQSHANNFSKDQISAPMHRLGLDPYSPSSGCGSKLNSWGCAGVGLLFHPRGPKSGPTFSSHSHPSPGFECGRHSTVFELSVLQKGVGALVEGALPEPEVAHGGLLPPVFGFVFLSVAFSATKRNTQPILGLPLRTTSSNPRKPLVWERGTLKNNLG